MKQAALGRLLRGTLRNGQVRVLMCDTTNMTELCRMTHEPSNVCAAALGRGISAAALLTASADDPDSTNLTMTIKGGGPAGALVVVAHGRRLKAYIDHPQVELPLKANGKLDVGGALGKDGMITVVRDLGMREPYVGQCELQSGEIGEDVAYYCVVSEQQPTLCALGVLVNEGRVISSGGVLVQPLPGCEEETLAELETRSMLFGDISAQLLAQPMEDFFKACFDGMEPETLDVEGLTYTCDCSRERMERALISIGQNDLQEIIDDDQGAELVCNFCHEKHQFTTEELKALLAQARPE